MPLESYPDRYKRLESTAGKLFHELPGAMKGFHLLHTEAMEENALPKKIKELMALAISITSRCEGCIAYHVHDSLHAGATRDEVLETIGVGVLMGGGPAFIYACEALDALKQFEQSS